MSAPRSKRDDASVLRPSRLLVRRTDAGLKYALSNTTVRVVGEISDALPPMTPATACARSRSAMTSISASSVRATPSSVVSRSPAVARRIRSAPPARVSRSKAWSGWPSSNST